jgi:hypothetical protein
MTRKPEWYVYRIGELPSDKWVNNDCVPFDSVHHNCHVGDAFRLFVDGQIQSSLVWDESMLRNTRTCVSWVSANTWSTGSIYGNVRFEFDWKKLIDEKQFYWVEAVPSYKPPAFRILISEDPQHNLEKYDVESRDGPLYYHSKSDTWYRNGDFTSEFLLDSNLPLSECTRLVFDDHHTSYCRRKKSQCPYLGKPAAEAGAELVARLVAHNLRKYLSLFLDGDSDPKCLNTSAAEAYLQLRKAFKVREDATGTMGHDHPAAPALVSAILDHYGFDRPKGVAHLRDLFKNTEELRKAFIMRLSTAFGVPSENALKGEEED